MAFMATTSKKQFGPALRVAARPVVGHANENYAWAFRVWGLCIRTYCEPLN